MKLVTRVSVVIMLVVLATALFLGLTSAPSNAPRFEPAQAPASIADITYDFLNARPFEGGKMWVYGPSGGTNSNEVYIFDIENRRVLGGVTNCWPAMLFGEPLKLLCYQSKPIPAPNGLKQGLLNLLVRVSGGRIKLPPAMAGQTYWLLDLNSNVARRLGDIPGSPNSLMPSPDFHYCFTTRLGQTGLETYVLDLHQRRTQRLAPADSTWVYGWWDNTRLLLRTTNLDFVLYDMPQKTTSPLITFEKLAVFLKNANLSDGPKETQAFVIWNGRENDFYLTDLNKKWLANESFLIKVERPDGRLRLLAARFKFEWSDHLDRTGRYYLYSRRDSGQGSDGVFLRDLEVGTDRALVAPTTDEYFSIPRFYGDSIIYVRSNALWQIDRNGSNTVSLFPPAGTKEQSRL